MRATLGMGSWWGILGHGLGLLTRPHVEPRGRRLAAFCLNTLTLTFPGWNPPRCPT